MQRLDRTNSWLSLLASLAILVGLVLVAIELNQNTEHLRLQLLDQITARANENNRALLGENPTAAIEKSVREPENLTYAELLIVDAHLINVLSGWEDRFFLHEAGLVDASDWKQKIDEEVNWFFGNRFARTWWRVRVDPPRIPHEHVTALVPVAARSSSNRRLPGTFSNCARRGAPVGA